MQNRNIAARLLQLSIVVWLASGTTAYGQNVQSDFLLGKGLGAYHRASYADAQQQLTAAIDAGCRDPRAYYFRGLSAAKLGRPAEADADFVQGAALEFGQSGRLGQVDRSLERVQGRLRLTLESYRSRAYNKLQRAGDHQAPQIALEPAKPAIEAKPSIENLPAPARKPLIAKAPVTRPSPAVADRTVSDQAVPDRTGVAAKQPAKMSQPALAAPQLPLANKPSQTDTRKLTRTPIPAANALTQQPGTQVTPAPAVARPAAVAVEASKPVAETIALQIAAPSNQPAAAALAVEQDELVPTFKTSKIEQTPSDWGFGLDLGRLLEGVTGGNLPGNMAYLKVSQRFLQELVAEPYHEQTAVNDNIMGTNYRGTADTNGRTTVVLIPDAGQALIELRFKGSTDFSTSGPSGRVCLHSRGTTWFDSCKLLSIDGAGPRLAPASTQATTCFVTDQISTCVPRLRGRISVRVAWRRAAQNHGQASAEISRNSENSIGNGFNEAMDKQLASTTKLLAERISQLPPTHDLIAHGVHSHTTADALYFALLGPGASENKFVPAPKLAKSNPDVELHVHSALVAKALTDPQVLQMLQAAAGSLFGASAPQAPEAGAPATSARPLEFYWSPDRTWLTIVWNAPRAAGK